MCGIAGVYDPDASPHTSDVDSMVDSLTHRGPDAEGFYAEGPVALGHSRLSIIDLETGDQPIYNEDGDVVVVYNGEIYNHRSLRAGLEAAGHRFTTETDTEVLVHLYEEHGPEFVADLEGMFAFALYDATAERLVLARDPLGIKPLVVARDGNRLAFASEIPALFEGPVPVGGLDRSALGVYFTLGYVPSPLSAFESVEKLRPGERVVVDEDGLDRVCFYRPSIRERDPGLDAAAEELRDRLRAAVEKRLMSDVPLGAFLSGGIDSTVVVALMAELAEEPVETFTVGFEESRFDESWAGREVAAHFGTDHTEFTCTPEEVRELVPDVLGRLGEPFADPSLLPTYVVARETGDAVTVALSGDGGDELFAGYDKYRGEYYARYYRQLPRPLRERVVEPVVGRLPASRTSGLGDLGRRAQRFTAGGEPDTVRRHLGWHRIADDAALEAVSPTVDPLAASERSLCEAADTVDRHLPTARQDAMTRVRAIDVRHSLPDQLLAKVDTAAMYNSLEVRVPFLDTSVVEYAFSLPPKYAITPRRRKRVLKRAFASDLPPSILERSKQGFDMPIGEWFRGPLAAEFERVVGSLPGEYLDVEAVRESFEAHRRGRVEHGKFLWAVYVFARWHESLRTRGVR